MEEKVYYEETLSTGEMIKVTDSYVRYRKLTRKDRVMMDQVIPINSISSVNNGVHFNNKIEYLSNACSIIAGLSALCLWAYDRLFDAHISLVMDSLILLVIVISEGFVIAPVFTARYAIYIDSTSGEYIGILRRKFVNSDPQQLHDAVLKAIEENRK